MKAIVNLQQIPLKEAGLLVPDKDDMPVIARYGLGGAAVGGGTAALLSLIHRIRLESKLNKEREKIVNPTETDENTIVLQLPRKAADWRPVEHAEIATFARLRSEMDKHANDPATFAAAWLAALGGGAGMYRLVRKLYHKNLLKDIGQKEEAARTQLLDSLTSTKTAGTLNKSAAPTFGPVDAPLGMGLLLTLLGTGATGYLTKKVLDEQFREADRAKYEAPKVHRIVFRSAPLKEEDEREVGEKVASEDEIDAVRTLIVLHMAKEGADMSVFENADVKAAMDKEGLDAEALMGLTNNPAMSEAISGLLQRPELRHTLQSAYMQDHPILKHFKWALKLPGMQQLADKMTYDKLGIKPKPNPNLPVWHGIGSRPGMVGPFVSGARSTTGPQQLKVAGVGMGITNSLIGSMLAGKVEERGREHASAEPQDTPEDIVSKIQVSAQDPSAQEFIQQREERIRELLQQLAAEA